MEQRTFREQLFFLVLCLSVLKGDSRYIEVRNASGSSSCHL